MKGYKILIVIGVIAVGILTFLLSKQQSKIATNAEKMQIIFPVGGETLRKGETYTLKWSGGPEVIQIFLIDTSLKSAGASVSISHRIYGIKNNGTYDYTIPATLKDGIYMSYR